MSSLHFFLCKIYIFLSKSLEEWKISRTFASAFRESPVRQPQKEFFERLTQTEKEVVQEASIYLIYVLGQKTNRFNFLIRSRKQPYKTNYRISVLRQRQRHKICTTLLAAREEQACLLFRVATQSVYFLCAHKKYTMQSLILAQDERQLQA